MTDSNGPSETTEEKASAESIADWLSMGIKFIFGLAFLAVGLLAGGIALLLFAKESLLGAIGVGGFGVLCLYQGGRTLLGMRESESQTEPSNPGARPLNSEPASQAGQEAGPEKASPEQAADALPSSFRTITGPIGRVLASAFSGIASLYGIICLSGFLGGGLLLGHWTVQLYRQHGFDEALLFPAAGTLLIFGELGFFVLSWWRDWRASWHTYEKPPGAYRRAWSTSKMKASQFPAGVESWLHLLSGALVPGGAVVLATYFLIWPMFAEGQTGAALFLIAASCLFWGSSLYFCYQIYKALRPRLQYDRATFAMDPFPARLGGTLSGTIQTGMPLDNRPPDGFHVVLSCFKRTPRRKNQGRPRYETLWDAETQVEGQLGADGQLRLAVSFDLPTDKPSSSLEYTSTRHLWRLDVSTRDVDPPYEQSFILPVFPPDASPAQSKTGTPGKTPSETSN